MGGVKKEFLVVPVATDEVGFADGRKNSKKK